MNFKKAICMEEQHYFSATMMNSGLHSKEAGSNRGIQVFSSDFHKGADFTSLLFSLIFLLLDTHFYTFIYSVQLPMLNLISL